MRFNELSTEKTILDEAPVSMAKRLGDWAKSKTAFSLKDAGQREQLKNKEKIRIWQSVKNTLLADKSGIDVVSVEQLQDTFVKLGYGRSGKEVLKKFVELKRGQNSEEPKPSEQPTTPEKAKQDDNSSGLETPKPQVQSNQAINFESIIREAEAKERVLINKKEIEKIIDAVVDRAADTRPELFNREALRRQGKKGSEFSGEDRGAEYDDEDSEPTVTGDHKEDAVNKEDLIDRFERFRKIISRVERKGGNFTDKDSIDINDALEDLENFIDNL